MSAPPVPSATAPAAAAAAPRGAPGWLLALYLGGLAFVYLGERVLSGLPRGAEVATALGVVAAAAATGIRFAPRFRSGGERKSIESLLAVFSLVGLVGLLVYFLSGPGAERLGLDGLESETRDRVSELARVVWVSLIALSVVPMVFAELALRPMRRAERPESRKVRAAITTGLALALSAIYGALLVYAASGVDLRVDYSYFKTSRPSDSTKKLVSGIVKPIEIVAFFPDVNEVRSEVEAYLREVAAESKQVQLRVEDRLLLPKLAKELAVNQDGAIVLRQGDAKQSLTVGTAIEQARPKLKTLDRDFQEQLVKLVQSRKTAYVTVGHGELSDAPRGRAENEGARSGKVVRTLLQRQNYTVKDLGMAQGLGQEVPDDADIVLVLGPTEPLTRQEIDALSRYYRHGGRLILALDADAFSTRAPLGGAPVPAGAEGLDTAPAASSAAPAPSAAPAASGPKTVALGPDGAIRAGPPPERTFNDDLAEIVGLQFSSDLLANEKQHVRLRYNDSDRSRLVTNSFSSHAAVSTLSRNSPRAAAVFFGSGSLEKKPGDDSKVDFAVRSLTGTFRDKNKNYAQDKTTETLGLFNLAAAVSRPLGPGAPSKPVSEPGEPSAEDADGDASPVPAPGDKPKAAPGDKAKANDEKKDGPPEMRAFVVADADAFSDFVMGEVVGNQILLVDAVRWLVGESSVQGLPNTEEDVRIEHTKQGDLGWFYATIFGIPGLVLGSGLWFSLRTRGRARS